MSMPFVVPMVWREGKDHLTDCYLCTTNLKGINGNNKHHVQYLCVPSVIKPVSLAQIPVPGPNVTMESSSDSESSDMTDTVNCVWCKEDNQPVLLTQADFNDLT